MKVECAMCRRDGGVWQKVSVCSGVADNSGVRGPVQEVQWGLGVGGQVRFASTPISPLTRTSNPHTFDAEFHCRASMA